MNEFRLLITGSRTWDDYDTILSEIIKLIKDVVADKPHLAKIPMSAWFTIVHGNCPKGADKLADIIATTKLKCNVERYDADWRIGKRAGPIRNMRMVESLPDACLAFIRDSSGGATGCRNMAKRKGIPTDTIRYDPDKVTSSGNGIIRDGTSEVTGA